LYEFKDCFPAAASNYYRIRSVDGQTGKLHYNEIVSTRNGAIKNPAIYPNPFKDEFSIYNLASFTRKSMAILRNSTGQQVTISMRKENHKLIIHIPENLISVIYYLQLSTDSAVYNCKLVKE